VVRLELYVEPWNVGSIRTAERAGFVREGLLRKAERVGVERRDMFVYGRLRDDLWSGAG
jgi:RimJ/RimL family protein N-acetyltransferase